MPFQSPHPNSRSNSPLATSENWNSRSAIDLTILQSVLQERQTPIIFYKIQDDQCKQLIIENGKNVNETIRHAWSKIGYKQASSIDVCSLQGFNEVDDTYDVEEMRMGGLGTVKFLYFKKPHASVARNPNRIAAAAAFAAAVAALVQGVQGTELITPGYLEENIVWWTKVLEAKYLADPWDSHYDRIVPLILQNMEFAQRGSLMNILLDRAFAEPPLHGTTLDGTTLGKPRKLTTSTWSLSQPSMLPRRPLLASHLAPHGQTHQLANTKAEVVHQFRSGRSTFIAHANAVQEVSRLWLGQSQIPVAAFQPSDFLDLFGGALFLVLKRFQKKLGKLYLLPTGTTSSFLVLSDPLLAKHVLNSYGTYDKGIQRELGRFLLGDGFVTNDGEPWKIRNRAVRPSFHKTYLDVMVQRVFLNCTLRTVEVLNNRSGSVVNMEKIFSELTLDIIGKALFNYDFRSIYDHGSNPVIKAVYAGLKEVEDRSIDFFPVWKLPGDIPTMISPRQKRATEAVALIRKTTEEMIENCRLQLEAEEEAAGKATEFNEEDYVSEADPSILRFLITSREEVKSSQLRDDLLSMLIAGHETTAAVLTWTLYELTKHPEKMATLQKEIDAKLSAKIENETLTFGEVFGVSYLRWCVSESLRLYPQPPVLIRRALKDDVLPGGWKVPKGQDVMISVYNIHHSESVWSQPEEFMPERWSKYSGPMENPNELKTDFHFIPFSGGARKCMGEQFALLEAYTGMAVLLSKFDFKLVEGQDIGMTTAATIHTTNGMMMSYTPRNNVKTESHATPAL